MSNPIKEEPDHHKTKTQPGDAEWIAAFLKGDKTAFDRLVRAYQDRIYNLCYRMMGDPNEANDMAQETFIKVFRFLGGFAFKSRFSTWLYRIAVNTCNNRLKSLDYRLRKRMRPFYSPAGEASEASHREPYAADATPLAELEQKEQGVLIQKAIDTLSNEKKTVVILRDMEGLSYEEIAGITGLPVGTVKSKLARARQELARKLSGVMG